MNPRSAGDIRAHHNDVRPARDHFITLRREHPSFSYHSFEYQFSSEAFLARFHYRLENGPAFTTRWEILAPEGRPFTLPSPARLHRLLFDLGLVESISYWKASCSPHFHILPEGWDPSLAPWWRILFEQGLGEFLYRNSLLPVPGDFVTFTTSGTPSTGPEASGYTGTGALIPVGGGKDSVVSLELARTLPGSASAFLINPSQASRRCASQAGYPVITARRSLDPALLELNRQGFLNGHTPFSAMVAFATLLTAELAGHGEVLLSNESSANEATVPGTTINHQYSKTLAFESAFRAHCRARYSQGPEYFSFLRPLNELQITALFSTFPAYHPHFRSCNLGEKSDSWCGLCAKCLFVRLMLAPFLSAEQCRSIWKADPLDQGELLPLFDQLAGLTPVKPFECVGTVSEVRAACTLALDLLAKKKTPLPLLLAHAQETLPALPSGGQAKAEAAALLREWNGQHHLPVPHADRVRQALQTLPSLPCP